jgi:hypothetical protein
MAVCRLHFVIAKAQLVTKEWRLIILFPNAKEEFSVQFVPKSGSSSHS